MAKMPTTIHSIVMLTRLPVRFGSHRTHAPRDDWPPRCRKSLASLSNALDYGALVRGTGARTLLRVREMRGEKPVVKR
jgi:hypothetical protein